ncbi:MAG: tRNA (adenosine(37)-N6)-threonylcarbamoyltransferase complex dimerization subunit type 1 TsaB [Proteobacteria bacterium]|nr:tRNA (adenosine(37)-N6)-threonylcarbamoyltransferase complex dimerization subunit type 1 TsaB [Pseudomonadota bacterium]
MLILAFDTTNSTLSVALLEGEKILCQNLILESGKQSELLIPEIEKILQENKIWYQDLDLITATKGPGSFTGVRIGLAVARTLKIATNLPLILINSLEALAFKQRSFSGEIFAAIDAQMDELFIGSFLSQGNQITELTESQLVKRAEVLDFLPKQNFLLCGSGKKIISTTLSEKNLPYEISADDDIIEASLVGLLALEKFHSQKDFSKNRDPLYLRGAKITQRKK